MSDAPTLSPQDYARRLIRARNWHLVRAAAAEQEARRHDLMAHRLRDEICELGFDPQPPMGPRPA